MRQEAQAIVLAAGPGMRMTTLTARTAKCLLPVGTLPMIYYPLFKLQQAGFTEVTVVVSEGVERDILKLVEQYNLKLRLDIATVNTNDDPGTADSLREIANKIKKDVYEVIIMSCDLITDAQVLPILHKHYERDAALTILLADQDNKLTKDPPPGPKTKSSINDDIICTESGSDRLLYSVIGGDYDEMLSLGSRVMSHFKSSINISTKSLDAHLFIMKRWVLNYILHEESPCRNMGSLKAEIIPHIISCQMTKPDDTAFNIYNCVETDPYDDLIRKFNKSTVRSRYQNTDDGNQVVCYCFKHPGVLFRVNTIQTYWQVNRQIQQLFSGLCPGSSWNLRHISADIQPKAQLSEDTVVGMSSVISEKTNVSKTVVGNHCKINPLTRISNSVLAPYVNIAEGCVIENCLISANIEKKCTLRNCIVTDPNRIAENATYVNEVLEASQDYTD